MSTWFRTYGFAEVLDNLLIGAYPLDADDVAMLNWLGVVRVLNLVEDPEYRPGEREAVQDAYASAGIVELRLDIVDFGNLPPELLESAVYQVNSWLDEGLRSYVHCRAGRQRSAAVAAGVVALRQGVDIEEGLAYVRSRKPTAEPLDHQREDLRAWWHGRSPSAAE
jgi:atypical dual specificity phosphatase